MKDVSGRIERTRARDAALRRLRRLTGVGVAAATALAGLFAGLAARAVPGRTASSTTTTTTRARTATLPAAPAPIVPAEGAQQPQPAPSPPAQAPTPTPAPPVVSSGGS